MQQNSRSPPEQRSGKRKATGKRKFPDQGELSQQPRHQQATISELLHRNQAQNQAQEQDDEHLPPTNKRVRPSSSSIAANQPESGDMYSFSTAEPKPNGPNTGGLTLSNSTLQARPGTSSHQSNFTPHTGARRLVVKNLRTGPRLNQDSYFDKVWGQLDAALSAIFSGGKPEISLEELYKGAENVCRQGRATILAKRLQERCRQHVTGKLHGSLVDKAQMAYNIETLRSVVEAWKEWQSMLITVRWIFYYLDQSFLLHSKEHPVIREMGLQQFRQHIYSDPTLQEKILQGACDLVSADRSDENGIVADSSLLRNAIELFHSLDVYVSGFEPVLVSGSKDFFSLWAQQEATGYLASYVENSHRLIEREMNRCEQFSFNRTTKQKLSESLDQTLVTDQESVLLSQKDVLGLLRIGNKIALGQLYTLLERRDLGAKLKGAFSTYIVEEGTGIVFDESEADMVVRLLSFKKQLDDIWNESFRRNEGLGHALRESFESFMNKGRKSDATGGTDNPKTGEMIAKYVDRLLRGGWRLAPTREAENMPLADEDAEINRQLDQVLDLFRFVHGKAVFEAFYKNDLARRLLMGRSASDDAEKSMLARLKTECGSSFTHNLESMFKDMEVARDEMSAYNSIKRERQTPLPVDLHVSVLSASAWPTYPDVQGSTLVPSIMAELGSPIQPQLTPVGEKSLPAKCKTDMITYCPSMDLIAVVSDDEELRVFRLNGQKVFGGSYKGDPYLDNDDGSGEIRAVRWKIDGHFLAVVCADSTVRIISAYSGKMAHHYQAHGGEQSPKVTCLGWGMNFTDSEAAKRQIYEAAGQLSVEDLLSLDMQPSKTAALLKADLPRELALLDIESSLPRLSTLPSTGGDDDVFSSRASIDAIFHSSQKDTSGAVDVLLVGFEDGTVHLRIFDCFEIGSVRFTAPEPCAILQHASHPLSSTHALVASSGNDLHLLTLDLRFITRSGRYLSLLAHKTTQLQSLLRYICQVQRQIEMEWKNAQELPARYMRSVNQDLEEKCHCDFVTAAYHLVVTGDCFEPLREFLTVIVGERGHKRWEKAVASGYEIVRRLTHECLLPALERCEVLLSRLIGLSKFQKLSEVLGLETSDLNAIVETLDCLHLLAHHILITANEELTQFHAFSRWLRHQIEMLSAEPMSQTLEELMEKTDLVEYPLTLKYIRGALTKSSLRNYIQQLPMMGFARPPPPSEDNWVPTDGDTRSFYDKFKKLLNQQSKASADAELVELPKLNNLTKRLGLQFDKVFSQIAVTQKRGILHRSPLTLHHECDKTVFDSTMRYEDVGSGEQSSVIYVASRLATSKHLLHVYRVVLNMENGVSSTREARVGVINLHEGIIRQVHFAEGNNMMVLWSNNVGTSYVLQLPFQPPRHVYPPGSAYQFTINYHNVHHVDAVKERTDVDISTLQLVKHQFAAKARPIRIDVNGRQGRRAICVLYAGAIRYEVLDLDAELGDEDDEGDE